LKTYDALHDFGPLLEGLDGAETLLTLYASRKASAPTALNEYGRKAIELLKPNMLIDIRLAALPELTDEEKRLIEGDAAVVADQPFVDDDASVNEDEIEQQIIDEAPGKSQPVGDVPESIQVTGGPVTTIEVDGLPEYNIIKGDLDRAIVGELKQLQPTFFYPCWKMPHQGPLLMNMNPNIFRPIADAPPATPDPIVIHPHDKPMEDQQGSSQQSATDRFARSSSFLNGRYLSQQDLDEAPSSINELVGECLRYLKDEAVHRIWTSAWRAQLQDLVGVNGRPAEAEAAVRVTKDGGKYFSTYSRVQLRDNWWHCRKLLQAIQLISQFSEAGVADPCPEAEATLAQLIAFIHGGASDPIPWLPVIDHVLGALWRVVIRQKAGLSSRPSTSSSKTSCLNYRFAVALTFLSGDIREQKVWQSTAVRLFNEFATFVHGTVINGLVMRYPYKQQSPQDMNVSDICFVGWCLAFAARCTDSASQYSKVAMLDPSPIRNLPVYLVYAQRPAFRLLYVNRSISGVHRTSWLARHRC